MYSIIVAVIVSLLICTCVCGTTYHILKTKQDKMFLLFLDARAELHLLKDELKSNGQIK